MDFFSNGSFRFQKNEKSKTMFEIAWMLKKTTASAHPVATLVARLDGRLCHPSHPLAKGYEPAKGLVLWDKTIGDRQTKGRIKEPGGPLACYFGWSIYLSLHKMLILILPKMRRTATKL